MKATQSCWIALLTCGCLRFGYDPPLGPGKRPDRSNVDAGAMQPRDSAVAGAAATAGAAARAGAGGSGGARGTTAGRTGSGGAAGIAGAGGEADPMLGNSGLRVSDVLGFYSGDWGDMVLRKQGDMIWGAYQYDGGTIVGTITSDGVFMGWWTQLPSRTGLDAGEVEFRWKQGTADVIELDGRWHYGSVGDWAENWDVNLVTDRTAPAALTDRFNNPADFKTHP